MFNKLQSSILFRVGVLISLFFSLALASMLSSYVISGLADNDASAINKASTLRMLTYRLVTTLQSIEQLESSDLPAKSQKTLRGVHRPSVQFILDEFEATLNEYALITPVNNRSSRVMSSPYYLVSQQWEQVIKPQLSEWLDTRRSARDLEPAIENFLSQINPLVAQYQLDVERKNRWLRSIQVIGLLCILILMIYSFTSLRRSVKQPLQELTDSAQKISSGDFTVQIKIENNDELGILADTINKMSTALADSYGKLETRVEEKTFELNRSTDSLQFLLSISQVINAKSYDQLDFNDWLTQLSEITRLKSIDLCLTTADGTQPYLHVITDVNCNKPNCIPENCPTCIEGIPVDNPLPVLNYPLIKDNMNYGVLTCVVNPDESVQIWQRHIFRSFADLVAIALSLKNQTDQDRRMALMTERTTIARELHDSLAQALSYLKIQVTRLKRELIKTEKKPLIDDIIEELQQGLNAAYRQLRELLTTFRLQLTGVGLQSALMETMNQFREQRPEFELVFDYRVRNIPFTPNEEIHLLQLIREGTQNAIHHSQGTRINVLIKEDANRSVSISIIDNGIGISKSPEKVNHYGLAIMQERGRTLKGNLEIQSLDKGGTGVFFRFVPDYLKEDLIESS